MFKARADVLYHASLPVNRTSIFREGLRANKEGEVYVSPGLNYYFSDLATWDVWEVNPRGLQIETEDVGEGECVIFGSVPPGNLKLTQRATV